jgi:hypothetical protein
MDRRVTPVVAALLAFSALAQAQNPPAAPKPPQAPTAPQPPTAPAPAKTTDADRAALEEKFIKQMSGCALVGHFTDSARPDAEPREERYVITKVTKGAGDLFIFQARFGKVNLPLPIPVKWAGDTPVISVTNMGIPGMGTYTARVMIYDGQYMGMWSGATHGGNLWGKIEPLPKEEAQPATDEPKQPEGAAKQ